MNRRSFVPAPPRRVLKSPTVALLLVLLVGCARQQIDVTMDRAATTVAPATGPGPEQAASSSVGPGAVAANATITRVVDGDTVHLTIDPANSSPESQETVRLIGIDTPETHRPGTPVQCFGPEATRFTTALLPVGTRVRVERDVEVRDRYGRLLAYVLRADDGLFINLELARQGYAHAYTFPPNVAHTDQFVEAAGIARDRGLGLWSSCPG